MEKPYENPYKIEKFVIPKKTKFANRILSDKEANIVLNILKGEFETMMEDIDYYTDSHGDIILAHSNDVEEKLDKKLKEVV
jgi:hypothetical protein